MQVAVELQDMFSYSWLWILILILLIVLPFILLLIRTIKLPAEKQDIPSVNNGFVRNIPAIKNKHLSMLTDIEKKYSEGHITDKAAYQELSAVMRFFVYEMTGIKAQNFTLQEIRTANMPRLYELVAEYYAPEFAVEYKSDIHDSLNRARKVIYEWN